MLALGAFFINIVLFALKVIAAVLSGSLAVLSSAFDSLNDIISYFVGYYSVKQASRGPDYDHPFGHRRMEALAGIVMAIFAGILSFEILRSAAMDFISEDHVVQITGFTFGVLILTVIVKLAMHIVLKKEADETMSTALDAMAVDSRNDVLSNTVAIIGIAGVYLGQMLLDDAAAVVIAVYIANAGYQMAKKNYDYIVGARPDASIMEAIRKNAMVDGVKRVGDIRAHYVGDRVHAEIEIVLEKKLMGVESHKIGVKVQKSIESLKIVERAFVHIDYG